MALEARIADDPRLAEEVIRGILEVCPEISREWLYQHTGYQLEPLTNWILDNIGNIPLEPLDVVEEPEDIPQIPPENDWLNLINNDEKRDIVALTLIRAYLAEERLPDARGPGRRINHWIEWHLIKRYVDKRFPNVKIGRLQKLFSRLHVGTWNKAFIVATLVEINRFDPGVFITLRLQHLFNPDLRLWIHRRGPVPPVPDLLEPAEEFISKLVEEAVTDPCKKRDCAVCFDSFYPTKLVHCGEDKDEDLHHVCLRCFRRQACALCQDGKLAEGGQGLLCVQPGCDRIFLWAKVKGLLDKDTRRLLGRRLDHEALVVVGAAMEHCKTCNFGMIIETSKEQMQYFNCPRCRAHFCRECKFNWMDHAGRRCDELAGLEDAQARARKQLEEDLAAAVLRRCHRCGVEFAKEDGCNKMTCRCGATQCYVCRAVDIAYDHFCNHILEPGENRCPMQCTGCKLWASHNQIDQDAIEAVRQRAQNNRYLQEVLRNM